MSLLEEQEHLAIQYQCMTDSRQCFREIPDVLATQSDGFKREHLVSCEELYLCVWTAVEHAPTDGLQIGAPKKATTWAGRFRESVCPLLPDHMDSRIEERRLLALSLLDAQR